MIPMGRYSRHIQLTEIGPSGQEKIAKASVLVVGAGGLGCPVLQYLTAAGVGTIGIIDFDLVEESNLQRQVLFGTSSLGLNKALAAKTRLEDLNPNIIIRAYPEKLTAENALNIFKDFDIIVDGTDTLSTRYLINDAAVISNLPIVYGAIYKFEGQVSVFNYRNGPTYRCLFPDPPKTTSVANCSEIGVLGVLPGIIGCMQANEVLKIILGFQGILSGSLLCYHAQSASTIRIAIPRSSQLWKTELLKYGSLNNTDYEALCESPIREITAEQVRSMPNAWFIDVRNTDEHPIIDLPNCLLIPLAKLKEQIHLITPKRTYIVFCASGIRSRTAIEFLQQHHPNTFYNLQGGVAAIEELLNTQHE